MSLLPSHGKNTKNEHPSWASWTSTSAAAPSSSSKPSTYLGVGTKNTEGMSEETKMSLAEVERRDREMDEVELTRIEEGAGELKKIALNMNEALKKQTVGLDKLEEGMHQHRDAVVQANVRLKDVNAKARRWGGFGRNLMCMFLLIGQLLLLGFIAKYLINHR